MQRSRILEGACRHQPAPAPPFVANFSLVVGPAPAVVALIFLPAAGYRPLSAAGPARVGDRLRPLLPLLFVNPRHDQRSEFAQGGRGRRALLVDGEAQIGVAEALEWLAEAAHTAAAGVSHPFEVDLDGDR